MIRPNPVGGRQLHHADHDRLFSLLEELDVPMLLHEGRGGRSTFAGDRFDTWYATHVVSHPFEMMLALLGLVVEGVFERHPRLRVAILESGTGWLPWWLDRLDEHHERFGPMERPDQIQSASELFAHHCVIASDSDDRLVTDAVAAAGADHVVWSSDFPRSRVRRSPRDLRPATGDSRAALRAVRVSPSLHRRHSRSVSTIGASAVRPHRHHTAIGGPPASRVNNLAGHNS